LEVVGREGGDEVREWGVRGCGSTYNVEMSSRGELPCLLGTQSLLALQESLTPPDEARRTRTHAGRWKRFGQRERKMEDIRGDCNFLLCQSHLTFSTDSTN